MKQVFTFLKEKCTQWFLYSHGTKAAMVPWHISVYDLHLICHTTTGVVTFKKSKI